ncbi:MAG: hypothetical protein ABEJ31_05930 [Haloarculaceae archaeon]
MSESQSYEEVTVTSNGITVIKTFEADAFPVPAIAFRLKSDRVEPVTVRLVDDVPENVAVEDLGFHPEYGSEYWTIEDDEITFERELESEEQYTTVYGIRATGTDNVEQFLTEPEIADVDPPLESDDGIVSGGGSDVVRDVISGNADSVPGLDDEEDDEDIGTLDLADPNAEEAEDDEAAEDDAEETADAEADEGDDGDDEETTESTETATDDETDELENATNSHEPAVESVAAALAEEIRAGEVADDDLELLRDELDLGDGAADGSGADDARIQKLQTDVSDLQAYIDALEEFLEENGTGQDLIEDVQGQLESVQGELDSIQSDVEAQIDDIEADVADNDEQVEALDSDVGAVRDDLQSLKGDIKDLDDDIDELQSEVGDVAEEVDDVEDVSDQIDDIQDDIQDLKEWREQLSNVLGAADD